MWMGLTSAITNIGCGVFVCVCRGYLWSVVDFVGVVSSCGLCVWIVEDFVCVYIYIYICKSFFKDYFNVLDILF